MDNRQLSSDNFRRCFEKQLAPKRKCKFNEDRRRNFAWKAKLPAQYNLCAMDFSISSGGRMDVRRHQENASQAKLAKSKGSTNGGIVQYVAHGQHEVGGVLFFSYFH